MKIEINIEKDEQLRAYVKDLIKGQVMAIVREEFMEIVKEELERKVKNMQTPHFDTMIKDAVSVNVRRILESKFQVSEWKKDFIKPFILEKLQRVTSDVNLEKMIDDAARERIKKLI